MKTLDKIPTGKIERAAKLVTTGVKVGSNFVAYYGEKLFNPSLTKDKLNENNAEDIYDGLKSLKGSALKVAQMLSMDKSMMPKAYVDKFSLSQFSVPALSAPLVRKTFKKYLGTFPEDVFDSFSADAINAASIGQVHVATKNNKKLAVKIQYPGVAESISSDLALVKPFAIQLFNLKGNDFDRYFKEVESKLLEETDYELELKQSIEISEACSHINGLRFPKYYKELSSEKILTMDWIEGEHLSEFTNHNTDNVLSNKIAQSLWNFYMFQIHELRQVHADPHPGNFLIDAEANLIPIDFGCVKQLPLDFYTSYFALINPKSINDKQLFLEKMYELEIIRADDTKDDITYFIDLFYKLLSLFTKPFHVNEFDFSDPQFFSAIATLGDELSKDKRLRKMNGNRGSKHLLYINRTFFGLYSLLYDLKATVNTNAYQTFMKKII